MNCEEHEESSAVTPQPNAQARRLAATPKTEIQNPNEIQNSKSKARDGVDRFGFVIWNFIWISDFGFWIFTT
jgi:hypothetical protein